jgi:hypothetical protein
VDTEERAGTVITMSRDKSKDTLCMAKPNGKPCKQRAITQGLCEGHYAQLRRGQELSELRDAHGKIPGAKRVIAYIDETDYWKLPAPRSQAIRQAVSDWLKRNNHK